MSEVRVCALDELLVDSARRVDVDGHRLAVVRLGDDVHIIGDRCSHADYSLAEGELDPDACTIECWRHGAVFSLATGEPETLPATRPVPVYTVAVRDGVVYAELDEPKSGKGA